MSSATARGSSSPAQSGANRSAAARADPPVKTAGHSHGAPAVDEGAAAATVAAGAERRARRRMLGMGFIAV
jgi:hypothetical protein